MIDYLKDVWWGLTYWVPFRDGIADWYGRNEYGWQDIWYSFAMGLLGLTMLFMAALPVLAYYL